MNHCWRAPRKSTQSPAGALFHWKPVISSLVYIIPLHLQFARVIRMASFFLSKRWSYVFFLNIWKLKLFVFLILFDNAFHAFSYRRTNWFPFVKRITSCRRVFLALFLWRMLTSSVLFRLLNSPPMEIPPRWSRISKMVQILFQSFARHRVEISILLQCFLKRFGPSFVLSILPILSPVVTFRRGLLRFVEPSSDVCA